MCAAWNTLPTTRLPGCNKRLANPPCQFNLASNPGEMLIRAFTTASWPLPRALTALSQSIYVLSLHARHNTLLRYRLAVKLKEIVCKVELWCVLPLQNALCFLFSFCFANARSPTPKIRQKNLHTKFIFNHVQCNSIYLIISLIIVSSITCSNKNVHSRKIIT